MRHKLSVRARDLIQAVKGDKLQARAQKSKAATLTLIPNVVYTYIIKKMTFNGQLNPDKICVSLVESEFL